jgi:hypothetical protein
MKKEMIKAFKDAGYTYKKTIKAKPVRAGYHTGITNDRWPVGYEYKTVPHGAGFKKIRVPIYRDAVA